VSVLGKLKGLFFNCTAQFTQTAEERPLFRVIRERKVRAIVEIGVGDAVRTQRILEAAVRNRPAGGVIYAGIDLFEARSDRSSGLSLKQVHRKLKAAKAKVRLVPGDPYSALARVANSLVGTDLLIISADQQGESLDRAWFYVPRLLAQGATIFIEAIDPKTGESMLQPLSRVEVESLARKAKPRRAA
jgi:hypothetical protein